MGHMVQRWVKTSFRVDLKYSSYPGVNLLFFLVSKLLISLWILLF